MMVVVVWPQTSEARSLINAMTFPGFLLAIISPWLLNTHFGDLWASVAPGNIWWIAVVANASQMVGHIQMTSSKSNLWVAVRDVHALASVYEVRGVNILIFGLVVETLGACTGGSVTARPPTPDTFQHLLFLSDSWANVVNYTINTADPLQLTRWVWDARARPAHLLLSLWVTATG